jgi:serine protease Do
MTVEHLTPELARQIGLDSNERGVVVTDVDPDGLAARVGIRPGDLIVSIAGKSIQSLADFRDATRDFEAQAGIRMQVLRDGARRFVVLRSR